MSDDASSNPVDALDSIEDSDSMIARLLAKWRSDTDTLTNEGDDVDVRWERGSAAKLLLQHFAVRESGIEALVARLRADGHDDLAGDIEGDGPARREAIGRLDETVRGRQAIQLNHADVDHAVMALGEIFDREHGQEADAVDRAEAMLGASGERDLPSSRNIEAHATTHPSPEPGVAEKVGPLKAAKALYQHLRGTPTGGTSPGVDGSREHMPGV